MGFDGKSAERAVVEVLDALNGNRVVGLGFRLEDEAVATSCQCLPRPRGTVLLPDPDAPATPVLVRLRRPGTREAAFAVVAGADPFSGLALLRATTAAGVGVPDELNPDVPIEALIAGLEPLAVEPEPPADGPVRVATPGGGWVAAALRNLRLVRPDDGAPLLDATPGSPVVTDEGRVVGIVATPDGAKAGARLIALADHLPGWALRT